MLICSNVNTLRPRSLFPVRACARFRDNVVGLAATKISASVEVGIGGHSQQSKGDEQFLIDDSRTVREICAMLTNRGLQPVMSDYVYV
ncbi:hypothetical protein CE91St52_00990 [Phascolarctobacterium faecium]|nr:hypothetical protein [Phascolarctobacterium faecium]BDE83322.1 hypothetical protein CE91St52_00990 [Phascolarctobacterium faecium]BDE92446.1 hypothetical protein CE91St53_00980 [Phascolarctobacterium faecium]